MPRSLSLFAACLLALVFCAPGSAQDSPSLGDLARQAQKDKAKKPPAKVITNDDLHSSSDGVSLALGPDSAPSAQTHPSERTGGAASPAVGFEKLQLLLDQLDTLDAATLAHNVLGGNDSDFPGRAQWTARLYAAKQTFVYQSRLVMQKAKELQNAAAGMKDVRDPNDPRAKGVIARLQQLVQASEQNSVAFQAVMAEGKDLASEGGAH